MGSSRRFRGFEAHRMLEELRIRIRVFEPWGSASNPFSGHKKIEKPKMLRMKFWTSDFDVKKWPKRPRDPHNRIRLEKLCPKVVSDRKMAGRMPSKRRFRDFRPIHKNQVLNVNFSQSRGSRLLGACPGCRGLVGSEILEKLLRNSAPWIRNLTLDKQSGAWHSRELWLRYLGLGHLIGGLD